MNFKKILIVSTVARQFYLFEENNLSVLNELGYEVHGAANFKDNNERLKSINIVKHHILISRSPLNPLNLLGFFQLLFIIKKNKISTVHCHSPVGGFIGRLAAKLCKVDKIIYTGHGFHFFKGSPLLNWLIFYPIEFLLSLITDYLIVINSEDYFHAKRFKSKKLILINGIGVDINKYKIDNKLEERNKIRKSLNVSDDEILIISVGELSKRKNHKLSLDILSNILDHKFKYIICGTGKLKNQLDDYSKKIHISDKVLFLGYRNDIADLCMASDLFLNSTMQEGLPVSVLEAMAIGLPLVCSNVRGNRDLVIEGVNGYLYDNTKEGLEKVIYLIRNENIRKEFGKNNLNLIKKFSSDKVKLTMKKIYSS